MRDNTLKAMYLSYKRDNNIFIGICIAFMAYVLYSTSKNPSLSMFLFAIPVIVVAGLSALRINDLNNIMRDTMQKSEKGRGQ